MRRTGLVSFRFALLTSLGLVHACSTESSSVAENEEQLNANDTTPSGTLGTGTNDDDTGPSGGGGAGNDDDVGPGPIGTPPRLFPMGTPGDDDDSTADDDAGDDDAGDDDAGDDDDTSSDDDADDDLTPDDDTVSDDDTVPDDDVVPHDDDTEPDDDADDDTEPDDDTDDDAQDDDRADDDTGDDDAPPEPTCQASEELCKTVVHRPAAGTCASELPRARVLEGANENFACVQDTDCTAQPHGRCELWDPATNQIGIAGSSCTYGCVTDDDCLATMVCDCASPVGQCVEAHGCTVNADCDPGSLCARYEYFNGAGATIGYACTSERDQCLTNDDCASQTCGYDQRIRGRSCDQPIVAVGRPFLIDGEERVACVELRCDWLSPSAVDTRTLSETERQRLSQEWQRAGQMEHASIAAFARFALQLLALGAPPELVTAAGRAMRDETRHAQLVFGIASRYAGRSIGPGPLALDGALDAADWESILEGTVLEGCIGETVAALEAKEAAAHATDPELKAVLSEIAADEQRHAELAWQLVKWATQQQSELASRVEQLVKAELEQAEASARLTVSSVDDAESRWLLGHGVFSDARRAELRAEVLRTVVVPCAKALLVAEAHELASVA